MPEAWERLSCHTDAEMRSLKGGVVIRRCRDQRGWLTVSTLGPKCERGSYMRGGLGKSLMRWRMLSLVAGLAVLAARAPFG